MGLLLSAVLMDTKTLVAEEIFFNVEGTYCIPVTEIGKHTQAELPPPS